MKLAFVRDVMLGRLVNEAVMTRLPDYPWGTESKWNEEEGCLEIGQAGIFWPLRERAGDLPPRFRRSRGEGEMNRQELSETALQ